MVIERLLACRRREETSEPRRVPPLPTEYDCERKLHEDDSSSECDSAGPQTFAAASSASRPRASASSPRLLLLYPLLLQLLLQPVAACPMGCSCTDGGRVVMCPPGTLTEFPFTLPPDLTVLDISGNQLDPLYDAGLSSMVPMMHTLRMRNCSLTVIPTSFFASLTSLRVLDLAENDMAELEQGVFAGVSGLEQLNLSLNRRLVLPVRVFDPLPLLRSLDLSECGLADLEQGVFHGVEQLEELHLQNNRLSLLPRGLFSMQRRLRVLDVSGNKLDTTSSLMPLSHLRKLNVAGNMIKYMDKIDHMSKLERLDASHNLLLTLPTPPSFPSSLHALDLSHNDLRQLQTAAFDSLTELRHLNLSHNRRLEAIQMNAFVSLSSLEHLSLSHCSSLTTLSPAAFQPLPSSLRSVYLVGMPRLACSDCKLRSFPETVDVRGKCLDKASATHVPLMEIGTCEALLNQTALLVMMATAVVVLLVILAILVACCRGGGKDNSRPVTPVTAKHAAYGYGGHRKSKASSLSPPLLASSSSSSTSPSGRDVGLYEARLGAGPVGGGIIYGGYGDWEAGINGIVGSSGSSGSHRSDYSEIPAYTQAHLAHRYCVPRSTLARSFGPVTAAAIVAGGPRLPQTPPPSTLPPQHLVAAAAAAASGGSSLFPAVPAGTLFPPPKYSPPPPPSQKQQQPLLQVQQVAAATYAPDRAAQSIYTPQPQLLLQTPLALQQQLQQHQAASIQPPCSYSPLTRL